MDLGDCVSKIKNKAKYAQKTFVIQDEGMTV